LPKICFTDLFYLLHTLVVVVIQFIFNLTAQRPITKLAQNKYNTATQYRIHKQHKNEENKFSSLISFKDVTFLQNMSMSQHNKFAVAVHLAEGQFLRDAKNWL
jgi:hypothetical protein